MTHTTDEARHQPFAELLECILDNGDPCATCVAEGERRLLTDEELDERLTPLLAERTRRKEEAEKKWWDDFNEHHGPCPECGGRFIGGDGKVVNEHRVAGDNFADWWPMPVPPGYGKIIGVDWEMTLTCVEGHHTVKRETKFYDKPIPELFVG